MQAKMTKSQFITWLKNSEGRKYDFDGWYGFQCYDYANAGWSQLFPGTSLAGASAKNIPSDNKSLFKDRAKVYNNTPSFLAQPGDMVIFNGNYGQGHGHVGWVISATVNHIVVLEQNWLGGGWTYGNAQGGGGWEAVTRRVHYYDFPMTFIRPNFKSTSKPKSTTAKKSSKQTIWNWKGRFTANSTIKVRRSPGLKGTVVGSGSWIYKNQWVDFNQVIKKDGYWWIRFKYPTNPSAGYFYMAITKITDKKERLKKEKKLFGKIKYR